MARVILHVDDRPELPPDFAKTLAGEGYELLQTADPEEAIRVVEERRAAMVLMEIELDGCDGLDLLAGLSDPGLGAPPVLVLSCVPRNSSLHGEAIALGVRDFFTKPARAPELLAAIREIAPPAPEPTPEPAAAPSPGAMPGAMPGATGDLSDAPVPELLARLRRRGATGVLFASRKATRVGIQLRNGSPIAVGSNRRSTGTESFAELPPDEAEIEIRARAEALLYETFRWDDGHFRYEDDGELAPEGSFELGLDSSDLLLRAVLDASPAEVVHERLAKRATLYASTADGGEVSLDDVDLTPQQRRILEEVGGIDTLDTLLQTGAFDERLLYALWIAGTLELHAAPTLTLTELIAVEEPEEEAEPAEEAPVLAREEPEPAPPPLDPEPLDPEPLDPEPAPADEETARFVPETAPDEPAPEPREPAVAASAPEPAPIDRVLPPRAPDVRRSRPQLTVRAPLPPEPEPVHGEIAPVVPPEEAERASLADTLRSLAQKVMTVDDFEALDVPIFATDTQIQSAYERALAQIPEEAFKSADLELRARAKRVRDRIEAAYKHLKDPETRRAYALLKEEDQQDRDAKPSAERALEGERWFRKGTSLLKRRGYTEAAEAFGMAAHLDPGEGEYLAHLGYALYLTNPDEKVVLREAMEHVANGIKRSPRRELPYVYLGRIMAAGGDVEAARKLFRKALRIKPDFHPALQEIRLLEMRERKNKGVFARLMGR